LRQWSWLSVFERRFGVVVGLTGGSPARD